METTQHTETPWEVVGTAIRSTSENVLDQRCIVKSALWISESGVPDAEQSANLDFIIRACNAHDSLVEACEKAEYFLGFLDNDITDYWGAGTHAAMDAARDALANARKGQ